MDLHRVLPGLIVCLFSLSLPAAERVFRAGAAAVDVSPERLPIVISGGFLEARADKVQDPLHVRSIVIDDGEVRVAISIVDTLMMPRELIDEAKALASKATGIPADQMLVAATHTHSAPSVMGALGTGVDEEYRRMLPSRIARAIELAARRLAPARIGWTVLRDPEHTHCRRWIRRPDRIGEDPFGQRTVRAMMHPGYQNPDYIAPAGPVDDDLSIVSIQAFDGRPIALLANYSQHYVGAPPVSADYFGVFAERVQKALSVAGQEPPFVAILSQGTAGDLHWMDYSQPAKQGVDRFTCGEALALLACEAARTIQHRDWVPLAMRDQELDLGVRAPDSERVAWARPIVEALQGLPPRDLREVYAREQLLLAEMPRRRLKVQALRIGDLGITALPTEAFGITGLKIKARSPLEPTFNLELANGAEGYIPPPEQHALGGYTTWPARSAGLEVEAEPRIVEAVVGCLEKVAGKPRRRPVLPPCPYADSILASRPIAYWRLSDMDGRRVWDITGNGREGTLEGNFALFLEGPQLPGFAGEWRGNRSVHLAGGKVVAVIPDLSKSHSIVLWFWNGLPGDVRTITGCVLSVSSGQGAEGVEEQLLIGGTEPAGRTERLVFSGGGSAGIRLIGSTRIAPRTWSHVAFVRDGPHVAVYLDARAKPEIEGSSSDLEAPAIRTIRIGGRADRLWDFEGKVDEVAIFDRALSSEEVAAHHAAAVLTPAVRTR